MERLQARGAIPTQELRLISDSNLLKMGREEACTTVSGREFQADVILLDKKNFLQLVLTLSTISFGLFPQVRLSTCKVKKPV